MSTCMQPFGISFGRCNSRDACTENLDYGLDGCPSELLRQSGGREELYILQDLTLCQNEARVNLLNQILLSTGQEIRYLNSEGEIQTSYTQSSAVPSSWAAYASRTRTQTFGQSRTSWAVLVLNPINGLKTLDRWVVDKEELESSHRLPAPYLQKLSREV